MKVKTRKTVFFSNEEIFALVKDAVQKEIIGAEDLEVTDYNPAAGGISFNLEKTQDAKTNP